MLRVLIILGSVVLTTPATAQVRPVTETDFRAFTEKWTLYFTRRGAHYGSEQFYGRNRTTWQLTNGECLDGVWYMNGPHVCFAYDDADSPHCWTMVWREGMIEALPKGSSDPTRRIRVYQRDKTPLDCAPPDIGA